MRAQVGARLREIRLKGGLTMREVSEGSGVTRGFISQVENGHVMPSVSTLISMCNALRCHVGDLFDSSQRVGEVLRQKDRATYRYPETGVFDEILSSDPTGRLEVIHSRIEPGGGTGAAYTHGSDAEFVLVEHGSVCITVGEDEFVLERGDTLSFDGSLRHAIRNDSDEVAEVIWVMTPVAY